MRQLDTEQIQHLAKLARLAIDTSDISHFQEDLGNILTMIDDMQNTDTQGIEPMAHPHDMAQRLREDVVTETIDQRDTLMANAPLAEKGCFLVPQAVSKKG